MLTSVLSQEDLNTRASVVEVAGFIMSGSLSGRLNSGDTDSAHSVGGEGWTLVFGVAKEEVMCKRCKICKKKIVRTKYGFEHIKPSNHFPQVEDQQ